MPTGDQVLQQSFDDANDRINVAIANVGSAGTAGAGAVRASVAAGTGDSAVLVAAGRLYGYSFRETTGAAEALIYIRDGDDATDPIVAVISLGPNESDAKWYGDKGIALTTGLFFDRAGGNTEGALYTGAA
jgi:hypothetical protein